MSASLLIAAALVGGPGFMAGGRAPMHGAVPSTPPRLLMSAAADGKRVIMKFGGSSVRDAARIVEVAAIVKSQIDAGLRPLLVCSAMGKTTNNLLSAASLAIKTSTVDVAAVRTLHEETAATLGFLGSKEYAEVSGLMDECEQILSGVAMLRELSRSTRDRVVSYGERMSGRMVAAQLNKIGVPAVQARATCTPTPYLRTRRAAPADRNRPRWRLLTRTHSPPRRVGAQYESWDLGMLTNSEFGDASVLDEAWPVIAENVAEKIPPATVGVITGFIGADAHEMTESHTAHRLARAPTGEAAARYRPAPLIPVSNRQGRRGPDHHARTRWIRSDRIAHRRRVGFR